MSSNIYVFNDHLDFSSFIHKVYSMSKLKHADLLVIALLLFRSMCSERLREIRLQGFLPMTGTEWPAGAACLPATLMAVRHVNERVGLLDGYNVTYTWADSKVT